MALEVTLRNGSTLRLTAENDLLKFIEGVAEGIAKQYANPGSVNWTGCHDEVWYRTDEIVMVKKV